MSAIDATCMKSHTDFPMFSHFSLVMRLPYDHYLLRFIISSFCTFYERSLTVRRTFCPLLSIAWCIFVWCTQLAQFEHDTKDWGHTVAVAVVLAVVEQKLFYVFLYIFPIWIESFCWPLSFVLDFFVQCLANRMLVLCVFFYLSFVMGVWFYYNYGCTSFSFVVYSLFFVCASGQSFALAEAHKT